MCVCVYVCVCVCGKLYHLHISGVVCLEPLLLLLLLLVLLRVSSGYVSTPITLTETHDSIEDARAALLLAEMYEQLQATGTFEQTLEAVYRAGRQSNWVA